MELKSQRIKATVISTLVSIVVCVIVAYRLNILSLTPHIVLYFIFTWCLSFATITFKTKEDAEKEW